MVWPQISLIYSPPECLLQCWRGWASV